MGAMSQLLSLLCKLACRWRRLTLRGVGATGDTERSSLLLFGNLAFPKRLSPGERGFALLIVIVVVATLSLMISAVITATRDHARITNSHLVVLQLRGALDGGLATIGRDLSTSRLNDTAQFNAPVTMEIAGVAVTIKVRPEAAKIDINAADPILIEQLLLVSGAEEKYSKRIADEIVDWRGHSNSVSRLSVTSSDYAMAGRAYRPPHHAFESISELALLLDGNSDLVRCLAPDVTLFTHSPDVDLPTASDRVSQAARAVSPAQTTSRSILSAGIVGGAAGQPDFYEVTEEATDEASHITLTRQVVLRMTGDPRQPFWILSVTSPVPSISDAKAACHRLKQQNST
jgi:general secretion pathway protein K